MYLQMNTQSIRQDSTYTKYYLIEEWESATKQNLRNKLNIIHMNICSLRLHFDEFLVLTKKCRLDVICLTEINIQKEETCNYEIDGYYSYWVTREKKRGGGLVIYVRAELKFDVKIKLMEFCELIHGLNHYRKQAHQYNRCVQTTAHE